MEGVPQPNNAKLFAAMALAFAEIENAKKNAENPHFNSTYADLGAVLAEIRPVYAKHGLGITQLPGALTCVDGQWKIAISTVIYHNSGESIMGTLEMPVNKDKKGKLTAHAVGSGISFGRRYGASGVAGISQEDDDGNEAVQEEVSDGALELTSQLNACESRAAVLALKPEVQLIADDAVTTLYNQKLAEYPKKQK